MNKKKAYIYKMNLVPANVFSMVILVLTAVLSMILKVDFSPKVNTLVLFVTMILYLFLHELLHGLGYIVGGANRKNVTYGVCLEKGILYCMSFQELTKKNILISLQMPFTVIGLITYIVGAVFNIPLLVLLSIINICGASMDLAMFYYIAKLPKNTTYSESGENDEFVLISDEDLTKYKSIFLKIVEEKDYNEKDYIFGDKKKFKITKASIIILVAFLLLGLVSSLA